MQMAPTGKAIIETHKLPLSANGMVDDGWQLDLKTQKKKKTNNNNNSTNGGLLKNNVATINII